MHLDQPLHQSASPMPSPPALRSTDRSTWLNMSKIVGERLGRDADPGVPHRHHYPAVRPARPTATRAPPSACTWALVGEQVREHLGQPRSRSASRRHQGRGQRDWSVRARPRPALVGRSPPRSPPPPPASPVRAASSILFRLIRDTSSRSSISRTMCVELPVHHRLGL